MSSIFFSFGRSPGNSDFFAYSGGEKDYGLSKDLVEEAGQQGAKMKKALEERRWLHFAFNGARNYFGVYHADAVSTEQKLEWSSRLRDSPPTATCSDFLLSNSKLAPRVVFGPGDTMFCWTLKAPGGFIGRPNVEYFLEKPSLWKDLEEALNDRHESAPATLSHVALGVDGAYWLRYQDDVRKQRFALNKRYPDLTTWMVANKNKIVFLALHPQDPNQFFLVDERDNVTAVLSRDIWQRAEKALNADKRKRIIRELDVTVVDKTTVRNGLVVRV